MAECARRLLLASAIGMLDPESSASSVAGQLIAVFSFVVFAKLEPYKTAENNILAEMLAISLFLFFLAGELSSTLCFFPCISRQLI